MRGTPSERLRARLAPCTDPACDCSSCLLWTGGLDQNGYGYIRADGRMQRVHRVAWELEKDPIPDGFQLDHVWALGCRHKNCAKIAHLEPVTPRVNVRRSNAVTGRGSAQTSCVHGHDYTELNTYHRRDGTRECRTCKRATKYRSRRHRQVAA